jgi:plastocyanin
MRRLVAYARTFAISSALAFASVGVAGPLPASAAQITWHVQVGGGDEMTFATNRFYPNDITVHPGDTVEFAWGGFHTVTFNPQPKLWLFDYFAPTATSTLDKPNTFVNGAPLFGGPGSPPPPFKLTIGSSLAAGSYPFRCSLHQFMQGVITVTNGALPKKDADYIALGAAQRATDEANAVQLDAKLTRQAAHKDGEALAGAGDRIAEFAKFYPSAITIRAGDELTFTDRDLHEPHTVTFGPVLGDPSDPATGAFPSGPGSPSAFDGTSALNSGLLFYRSQYDYWNVGVSPISGAVPRTRFSVTFTTPGSYPFYCVIHGFRDPKTGQVFGMSGTITVLAPQGNGNNGGNN